MGESRISWFLLGRFCPALGCAFSRRWDFVFVGFEDILGV